MVRLHILSDDFTSPNGQALVYPIIVHRRLLQDAGIAVRIFAQSGPELTDCDVLIVDSKSLRMFWGADNEEEALTQLAGWAERTAVLFFDTTDSTGWINADVLPIVRRYYKNQVLRDRRRYTHPLYGGRVHTDYLHRTLGITDDAPEPRWPAIGLGAAESIRVSWNSGFANYSFSGLYRSQLYKRLRVPKLLQPPQHYVSAEVPRPVEVSCRMNTRYARATVAWQRQEATRLLGTRVATDRLSRRQYFQELAASRIVVSPFGFGEINYRDYEAFISGCLLLKPNMDHMETWPNFFSSGETIATHAWDLSDLVSCLDDLLADTARRLAIARQGQEAYRHFVSSRNGHEAFACRLRSIVDDARADRTQQRRTNSENSIHFK